MFSCQKITTEILEETELETKTQPNQNQPANVDKKRKKKARKSEQFFHPRKTNVMHVHSESAGVQVKWQGRSGFKCNCNWIFILFDYETIDLIFQMWGIDESVKTGWNLWTVCDYLSRKKSLHEYKKEIGETLEIQLLACSSRCATLLSLT